MTPSDRWPAVTLTWLVVALLALANPLTIYLVAPITIPCLAVVLYHTGRAYWLARAHAVPAAADRSLAVRAMVLAHLACALAGALALRILAPTNADTLTTLATLGWLAVAVAAARALQTPSPRRLAALAFTQILAWPITLAARAELVPGFEHPGNVPAHVWAIRLALATAIAGSALAIGAGAIADRASSGVVLPRGIVRSHQR